MLITKYNTKLPGQLYLGDERFWVLMKQKKRKQYCQSIASVLKPRWDWRWAYSQ